MSGQTAIRATSGTNHEGTSTHNRRVIIDALRLNGSLSRAELARATNLTKQTISNLIDSLETEGLVLAEDVVRKGRGQPSTPYRLVPSGAFAIGVQIDRHLTRIVAANLIGEEVARSEAALPPEDPVAGCAIILAGIAQIRQQLSRQFVGADRNLTGLGIAMPGPFGARVAEHDPWVMSEWQSFPLVETLGAASGLSVTLQNDATACARAEKMIGLADGLDNAICIYIGYGIGAGLILNGEVYTGSRGNAGEIGTMLLCGQGTATPFEHQASLASLYKYLGLDAGQAATQLDAILAGNDPRLEDWLDQAASALRIAVHSMEAIFDPQTVILCGGAPQQLIERLVERISTLLPSSVDYPVRALPRLQIGLTDTWAVARGAAIEPISRFFDPSFAAMLKNGAPT